MSEQVMQYPPRPDTSHLVTEDERPVDNRFSERQQRMLPHILLSSWHEAKPFEALADVGLFANTVQADAVSPDFLLSLGVTPRPVTADIENRSYLMWVYGKAPDLVIEIVSNAIGGELTTRFEKYARIRVTFYAVYDPFHYLGKPELRLYHLVNGRYVEMTPMSFMTEVGLGLVLWNGVFEDVEARWLRFVDRHGNMIPTAEEEARKAKQEAEDAKQEAADAKQEAADAKQAIQNNSLEIARRLSAQGLDNESILKATGIDLKTLE